MSNTEIYTYSHTLTPHAAFPISSIIETTRQQGYAVAHGGGVKALTGICAQIFDGDGSVDYALTVVVPTSRVRGRVPELVAETKKAAIDARSEEHTSELQSLLRI